MHQLPVFLGPRHMILQTKKQKKYIYDVCNLRKCPGRRINCLRKRAQDLALCLIDYRELSPIQPSWLNRLLKLRYFTVYTLTQFRTVHVQFFGPLWKMSEI